MDTLKKTLLRQIRSCGPISLSDYMGACLLDPDHGYYCRPNPIGAEGSFTTAPEISQMFGELIGICIGQAWMDQGRPDRFTLAELGPGRGTLMADLLRATARIPGFNRCAHLHLVERSQRLQGIQAERLRDHDPIWCQHADDLPKQPLFLVANEFFDALPIRQFKRMQESWIETLIGSNGNRLVYRDSGPIRCNALMAKEADTEPSDIVELRPLADRIICSLSQTIREFGGIALITDYGDLHLKGNTFQAVRDHRTANPLDDPGLADLTSHVDFSAIIRSAEGVAATPLITQGEFLGRMGIAQRANMLAASANAEQLHDHMAAYRRLTGSDQMGTLFKFVAFHPLGSTTPPGFP